MCFNLLYNLFVMNIGRVIMNKFNFLLIISCNILKSSQHMINLFNHFMTGINFLQIQFFLQLCQFKQRYTFCLINKFLKFSSRYPIKLFIFNSFIDIKIIFKTNIRKSNCIENILTYLINSCYYLFQLILCFLKECIE